MIESNEKIRHFTDLKLWQKAHRFFLDIVSDTKDLNNTGVTRVVIDQILRSTGSISANIAEGFNAQTTREYIRYLDIAIRTTAETENWFYKIKDLKILNDDVCKERLFTCEEISKMLQGLITSLKKRMH